MFLTVNLTDCEEHEVGGSLTTISRVMAEKQTKVPGKKHKTKNMSHQIVRLMEKA